MALAISSYEKLPHLTDTPGCLNLAWTVDERAHLAVDLTSLVVRELEAEAHGALPFIGKYFVQDPYGEGVLGPAVEAFFRGTVWGSRVTCGAGVDSLLHSFSQLVQSGPMYVIGRVYPDLPHWVERSGAKCVSRHTGRADYDHADNVLAARASVVLVERPALIGDQMTLDELEQLCQRVAPSGALVLVDESYGTYHPPSFSAVNIASNVQNIIVLRGLSKAYGLGGLRLGYCVTPTALTERVRAVVPPMLASSLSLRIGRAVLALGDIAQPLRERIEIAKAEMVTSLHSSKLAEVVPSAEHVPFVFCKDLQARVALEARGIIGKVQPFWSDSELGIAHAYRVSVPLNPDRLELLRAKCSYA